MKREILKDKINEDGSHTRIEKITQTPEDGFVSNREHRPSWEIPDHDVGMFDRGKWKGNKTTITCWRSHTKTTKILFFIVYLFMVLVFAGIFIVMLSMDKNTENINKIEMLFAGVMLFFAFGFVKSILEFRKKDQ